MRAAWALAVFLLAAGGSANAFVNGDMVAKWSTSYLRDKAQTPDAEPVLSVDGERFVAYTRGVIDSNYGSAFCPGSGVLEDEQIDFVAKRFKGELEAPDLMRHGHSNGLGLRYGYLRGGSVVISFLSERWPCRQEK